LSWKFTPDHILTKDMKKNIAKRIGTTVQMSFTIVACMISSYSQNRNIQSGNWADVPRLIQDSGKKADLVKSKSGRDIDAWDK